MAYLEGRDVSIDGARGLGILAVLIGHILLWGSVPSKILFVFHMPLFYFLSGLVYKRRQETLVGVLRSLVVEGLFAYLFFVIASFLIIFVADPYHACSIFVKHGLKSLLSSPTINFSLWFLISLTEVKVMFCVIERSINKSKSSKVFAPAFMLIIALLAVASNKWLSWRILPGVVNALPIGLFFYMVGYYSKLIVQKIKTPSPLTLIAATSILTFLGWSAWKKFPCTTDLRHGAYNMLSLPASLSLVVAVYLFSRFLTYRSGNRVGMLLPLLGRNSLYVFAMEAPVRYILVKIFNSLGFFVPTYPWRERFPFATATIFFISEFLLLVTIVPFVKHAFSIMKSRLVKINMYALLGLTHSITHSIQNHNLQDGRAAS